MDSSDTLSSCCICFEEFQQLLTLLPCRHTRICYLCVCYLTQLKCPICRESVDSAVLSIKPKTENATGKENSASSLSIHSKISLSGLIEYRNQRSKEIVDRVYQVTIIGSSSVGFRNITRRLRAQYALSCEPSKFSEILKKIQTFDVHKGPIEFLEALHVLDGVEKWNTRYFPNCKIQNHFIRVQCFPFWEWLRILRESGTRDVILPDVVVTCFSSKNKRSFSESLEMQKIMHRCYQLCHRTLQSIWMVMRDAKSVESHEKLSLHFASSILEKPNVILWFGENGSSSEYQELGSHILKSCLKSRKRNDGRSESSGIQYGGWDLGQMVLTK